MTILSAWREEIHSSRSEKLNRPDEHQRPIFTHGEIDVEGSDRGTAELHMQD
jgi:hypothetical protein